MRNENWVVAVLAAATFASVGLVGCSKERPTSEATVTPPVTSPEPTPPAAASNGAAHRVNLMAAQGGQVGGALDLVASDGAVTVTGLISGMKPESEHGFHIHEKGDCSSPDFKSAGDHFNPTMQDHGNPASPPHHLGDVPNIKANNEGKADISARVEGVTLGDGGPNDIVGKAFVVHEKVDDYKTQPSGNSGDRISCGVIE